MNSDAESITQTSVLWELYCSYRKPCRKISNDFIQILTKRPVLDQHNFIGLEGLPFEAPETFLKMLRRGSRIYGH